jgi:hypothetical protein
MISSKENYISHDRAIEEATKYLIWKYKSKSIDSRAVPAILRQLCGFMKAMPTPLLSRHSSGKGYELTDFAWSELGGKDYWFDREPPVLPPVELPADQPVVEAEEQPDSTEPAPAEPIQKEEDRVEEPALAEAIPEEESPPAQIVSTEIKERVENVSICLESAAKYLGKACRLAEISSHLSALQAEKEKIEKWMEKHRALKGLLNELRSISDIPQNKVDDLTKP